MDYYENGVAGGELAISVSGPPPPPVPPAPTYFVGTIVFNGIQLYWSNSLSATYYYVYRQVAGSNNWEVPAIVSGNTFIDTTVTPGTAYFYDVRPYNGNGHGPDVVLNPSITYPGPSVPSLTATTVSGGINLSWPDVPGAVSYNISRAVAGAGLAPYTSVGQSPYLDTGSVPNSPATTPGKTYYYQLTAVDSAGRSSGASNLVHADFPLTYTGSVDRADIGAISGWAKDAYNPANTLSVDLFDGAALIQSAVPAANARADVGSHGFSVTPPAGLLDGKAHTLSIKYSGTNFDLPGSPRTFNPPAAASLRGYLDYVNTSAISGWAQDSSQPSASLNVNLYDGATLFASVPTNITRSDITPGSHGFSFPTPPGLFDGKTHVIRAVFGGTSTDLSQSPVTINPPAAASLKGYLDYASQNGISGWTQDSSQPSVSLNVDLYDGTTRFAAIPANLPRADITPGNHKFLLALPTALADGKSHVVHAYYAGTATELPNSPQTVFVSPVLPVPNFSFEVPKLSAGTYTSTPAGAGWTFAGGGGISTNGTTFAAVSAPDGVQAAYLQGGGTISQAIPGFVANTSYTVTVAAAQRSSGNSSSQTVQVSLDGVVVGAFTPTGTSYADYTVNYTAPTSGSHTLTFTGTNPNGGDNTALIDNVRIVKVVNPDFSVSTDTYSASLSLADGDTVDGGPYQTSITTAPYNGFTGAVTLSLSYLDASGNLHSGAPGGMYYWFDPAMNNDETTSLVTISDTNSQSASLSICSCEGNPALGTYTLIVTATSGSVTHTTSMTLTITN